MINNFLRLKYLWFLPIALIVMSDIADAKSNNDLVRVLQKFKNYRFGEVGVYEIRNVDELKQLAKKDDPLAAGGDGDKQCVDDADPAVASLIQNAVANYSSLLKVQQDLLLAGFTDVKDSEVSCVFNYYEAQRSANVVQNKTKGYFITTLPNSIDEYPEKIIAMIMVTKPSNLMKDEVDANLGTAQTDFIYTYEELEDMSVDVLKLEGTTRYNNVYDFVYSYFDQGNVLKKTMEARGIGTDLKYFADQPGTAAPISSGSRISDEAVQTYMRISEGEPLDYYMKNHELVVSPDLIRWTKFKSPYLKNEYGEIEYDENGIAMFDSLKGTNSTLPDFGIELKYGIDEINYISFFSERMTLSALWENVKFGLILPTGGWASLSQDVFSQERRLTHGGVGVSAALDFPIPIVKNSGVFSMNFGYVFGDAVASTYKDRNLDPFEFMFNQNDIDYMVRANGQVHYTFGMAVDEDYLFRFGVGGTFYVMDKWRYQKELVDSDFGVDEQVTFVQADQETIGGISGIIEFMARNKKTPFGGSLQYFDEALRIHAWVQVPIVDNLLSARLEAKGYSVVFRESPHAWEASSVFFPMFRLIYLF